VIVQEPSFPPHTEEVAALAEFFDLADTTQLKDLEEIPEAPERNLVSVSLRLPRHDVEVLKRVAAQEGLAPSTFMRWVLRRFVRSLASGKQ
jgi:predicted DNA binding CopG/RHH family protein|tara:strand:+ start:698 stop:970 length:273 start_codon:yes stop_codon:yes gene_type:complete